MFNRVTVDPGEFATVGTGCRTRIDVSTLPFQMFCGTSATRTLFKAMIFSCTNDALRVFKNVCTSFPPTKENNTGPVPSRRSMSTASDAARKRFAGELLAFTRELSFSRLAKDLGSSSHRKSTPSKSTQLPGSSVSKIIMLLATLVFCTIGGLLMVIALPSISALMLAEPNALSPPPPPSEELASLFSKCSGALWTLGCTRRS